MNRLASLLRPLLPAILVSACCTAKAPSAVPTEPTVAPPVEAPVETPPETPPVEARSEARICGGGLTCEAGNFCDVATHCGEAGATGLCAVVPAVCTRDYRPVCGCDGQTYGNACTAHAAGVSVRATGECAPK